MACPDQAHIACCYQQVKTIHRLLLVLADDLGDLSVERNADPIFAEASDCVSGELEPKLMAMRDALLKLSAREGR